MNLIGSSIEILTERVGNDVAICIFVTHLGARFFVNLEKFHKQLTTA
jgi:hypothetical protein